MRLLIVVFIICLLIAPSSSFSANSEQPWNEYTIMPEDFKDPKAPTFEQYPVAIKFSGKPAPVNLSGHSDARSWRTRLKEGAKAGPNFADHMTVATWGCGAECISIAFIDAKNGNVFFDKKLETLVAVNLHDDVYDKVLSFERSSNLIIAAGCPNEECSTRRGVSYFLWTGTGLKEIYHVPRKWYPSDRLKGE